VEVIEGDGGRVVRPNNRSERGDETCLRDSGADTHGTRGREELYVVAEPVRFIL